MRVLLRSVLGSGRWVGTRFSVGMSVTSPCSIVLSLQVTSSADVAVVRGGVDHTEA